MRLDGLAREAVRVPPLRTPVSLAGALKAFIATQIDVLPIMQGNYLSGLYFRDVLLLIGGCSDGRACSREVPASTFREIHFVDMGADEDDQIEGMKATIESETSTALMNGGIYIGMVPLKKIVSFVHERRIEEAITASPLTGLPGNLVIKKEFEKMVSRGEQFFVCYLDLNDFKAYNDKYGIARGDDAIKFTAYILTRQCRGNFVGHVGGDDFIFFLNSCEAEPILGSIIEEFDKGIMEFYNEVHRRRGSMISVDREGNPHTFPLMSAAIACAPVDGPAAFDAVNASLVNLKEEVKAKCKKGKGGSQYAAGKHQSFAASGRHTEGIRI